MGCNGCIYEDDCEGQCSKEWQSKWNINVDKELFLSGVIAYKVKTEEQSKTLINIAKEAELDTDFEIDTYENYPYYYIEDDYQLQASYDKTDVLEECKEIIYLDYEDVL